MKVTWPETTDIHGSAVTEYRITFNNGSVYVVNTDHCDGTGSTTRECTVPMSVFSDTYLLAVGTLIEVKVEAKNAIGYSTESLPNTTGATVKTEPVKVTGLANGSSTNAS